VGDAIVKTDNWLAGNDYSVAAKTGNELVDIGVGMAEATLPQYVHGIGGATRDIATGNFQNLPERAKETALGYFNTLVAAVGLKEALAAIQTAKQMSNAEKIQQFQENVEKIKKNQSHQEQIGSIKKLKKIMDLPDDTTPEKVYLDADYLNHILTDHPDKKNFDFNSASKFVQTINLPERAAYLPENQRLLLYKTYTDQAGKEFMNRVVTKPLPADGKTAALSSYSTEKPREINKWTNASESVSAESGGATRPSSTSVGGRIFPTSDQTNTPIILQSLSKSNPPEEMTPQEEAIYRLADNYKNYYTKSHRPVDYRQLAIEQMYEKLKKSK
jgi:hypothetical protein